MVASEPPGSSRNRICCLFFYASSSQTLSIYGLPLGDEGHMEHLIHSSRLISRETNLITANGRYGLVRMGRRRGKLYTINYAVKKSINICGIESTNTTGLSLPIQPEGPGRPQNAQCTCPCSTRAGSPAMGRCLESLYQCDARKAAHEQ